MQFSPSFAAPCPSARTHTPMRYEPLAVATHRMLLLQFQVDPFCGVCMHTVYWPFVVGCMPAINTRRAHSKWSWCMSLFLTLDARRHLCNLIADNNLKSNCICRFVESPIHAQRCYSTLFGIRTVHSFSNYELDQHVFIWPNTRTVAGTHMRRNVYSCVTRNKHHQTNTAHVLFWSPQNNNDIKCHVFVFNDNLQSTHEWGKSYEILPELQSFASRKSAHTHIHTNYSWAFSSCANLTTCTQTRALATGARKRTFKWANVNALMIIISIMCGMLSSD